MASQEDDAYSCTECGLNASVELQKDEALRAMLEDSRARGQRYFGSAEQMGDARAHRVVAQRLAEILGEH